MREPAVLAARTPGRRRAEEDGGPQSGPQEREILSGGMNPVSPRALRATRPSGRTTRWVMLPLLRERRSQPSGGNCSALRRRENVLGTGQVGQVSTKLRVPPPQMRSPWADFQGPGPASVSPSCFQMGFLKGRSYRADVNPTVQQGVRENPVPLGWGSSALEACRLSHKHTG